MFVFLFCCSSFLCEENFRAEGKHGYWSKRIPFHAGKAVLGSEDFLLPNLIMYLHFLCTHTIGCFKMT